MIALTEQVASCPPSYCDIKERIMRGHQIAPLLRGACEPWSTAAQLLVHLVALL
jgi:hypothetical protein